MCRECVYSWSRRRAVCAWSQALDVILQRRDAAWECAASAQRRRQSLLAPVDFDSTTKTLHRNCVYWSPEITLGVENVSRFCRESVEIASRLRLLGFSEVSVENLSRLRRDYGSTKATTKKRSERSARRHAATKEWSSLQVWREAYNERLCRGGVEKASRIRLLLHGEAGCARRVCSLLVADLVF